jgi:hypothetical protein
VNNLPYLGFRGGVLARLKGERRQALQGNITFVILTDLNLEATKDKNEHQIIKKFALILLFQHFTGSKESPQGVGQRTKPVNCLAAYLYATQKSLKYLMK